MAPTVTRYPGYPGQAPLGVPQAASRYSGGRKYAPQVPQDRSVAPPVLSAESPPRVSRLNDSLNWGTQHLELPIKNTFIEFPHMTPPTGAAARAVQSCPPSQLDKENAGNLPVPVTPPFTPQKDEIQELVVGVDQAFRSCSTGCCDRPATVSMGSDLHPHECKPCAWYHHARGCQRGADCEFCHLCPAGEIKRRKKEKYRMLRESKEQ
jgi:hypothetical protein